MNNKHCYITSREERRDTDGAGIKRECVTTAETHGETGSLMVTTNTTATITATTA